MPGDHSELEPPLPIPNRSVKQLRADDSADTRVKVGHRQALIPKTPRQRVLRGVLSFPAVAARGLAALPGRLRASKSRAGKPL